MSEQDEPKRTRPVTHTGPETRTVQADAGFVDINSVIAGLKVGNMPTMQAGQALYGDFTDALDLQSSIIQVQDAQDSFMALPSTVRAAAKNDPSTYVEMCSSPAGVAALRAAAGLDQDDALSEDLSSSDDAPAGGVNVDASEGSD